MAELIGGFLGTRFCDEHLLQYVLQCIFNPSGDFFHLALSAVNGWTYRLPVNSDAELTAVFAPANAVIRTKNRTHRRTASGHKWPWNARIKESMPSNQKPKGIFDNDRDNEATRELTKAVNALTAWLKANVAAVTKADLDAAKAEIIKAIGERVNPEALKGLFEDTDKLDAAVKANTPISGS